MKAHPAIGVACPACGRAAGRACSDDVQAGQVHKWRTTAAIQAGLIAGPPKCKCRNHHGGDKIQHRSQERALQYIAKRRRDGMRYEVYKCPTSASWHIRTAKTFRPAQPGKAA